jgi:leader peptidase (prepilin peptidase)/N-methyltransferase
VIGIVTAGAAPASWPAEAAVSPALGAAAIGAAIGLAAAIVLTKYGFIQRSFIDAEEPPPEPSGNAMDKSPKKKSQAAGGQGGSKSRVTAVAIASRPGLNVRTEILREVVFLAPPVILAFVAYMLVAHVGLVRAAWAGLHGFATAGHAGGWHGAARYLVTGESALFGYMIGGLLVWGTRILGTLAFGKEAMGLGDVHIMAAVGACTGWVAPTLAFFLAPIFGLAWALYLWLARGQRELPYGPWLAAASVAVMLFHDKIMAFVRAYFVVQ